MVPANIVEKMYVHIALKKPKDDFRYRLTPEINKLWDQITLEIRQIRERGDSLEMFSELPDIEIPNPS